MRYSFYLLIAVFLAVSAGTGTAQPGSEKTAALKVKPAGVKRIGVLLPTVSLVNAGDRVDPAEAVRSSLVSLLRSSSFEFLPLEARLNALALKEAADNDCDYVLKVTLTQKPEKEGGLLSKVIDRAADSAITQTTSRIPMGKNVPASVGRESVVGIGQEATQIEFTIRSKDEFILEFKMSTPKGQAAAGNTLKAKATKDNDDVLIPLIEKAADEIASFLLR